MASAVIVIITVNCSKVGGVWAFLSVPVKCWEILLSYLVPSFERLKPGIQESLGEYMPSAWGLWAELWPPASPSCSILWDLRTDFLRHHHPVHPPSWSIYLKPLGPTTSFSHEWDCVNTKTRMSFTGAGWPQWAASQEGPGTKFSSWLWVHLVFPAWRAFPFWMKCPLFLRDLLLFNSFQCFAL